MVGAGDIAGTPGAGAHPRGSLDHRAHHLRMLGHAEVIVRAPDHHIARALRRVPDRMRKPARQTFEIGENPVTPFIMKLAQSPIEKHVVIHDALFPPGSPYKPTRRQVDALKPTSGILTLIQIRKSGTA